MNLPYQSPITEHLVRTFEKIIRYFHNYKNVRQELVSKLNLRPTAKRYNNGNKSKKDEITCSIGEMH